MEFYSSAYRKANSQGQNGDVVDSSLQLHGFLENKAFLNFASMCIS